MYVCYSIFIRFYGILMHLGAIFNTKATKWINGRKEWKKDLKQKLTISDSYCWIHCASAGEFEQAIPLIKGIRNQESGVKIAVSFFSPSGFEMYQDSGLADIFFYLPLDTRQNAENLIKILNPSFAIFIRNEIWWNILTVLKEKNIPAYLVNANLEQERSFIYKKYLSKTYPLFTKIFDTKTYGNTKLEKVTENKETVFKDEVLENFCKDSFILILGSSWLTEEKIAANFYKKSKGKTPNLKIIIVPHEYDDSKAAELESLFGEKVIVYSQILNPAPASSILFLDKKGILKYVYRYGDIALIGGGFGKGVHNVSEAAVHNIPSVFGPNYSKLEDIKILEELHIAFSGTDEIRVRNLIEQLSVNHQRRNSIAERVSRYFSQQSKVSERILAEVFK